MNKSLKYELVKKITVITIFTLMVILFSKPIPVSAREGDNGYEGGISSGEAPGKITTGKTSFEYQEICFITGQPVELKGTLTMQKTAKSGSVDVTYVYSLKNVQKAAELSRTISIRTAIQKKEDGQTVEESTFSKAPSESLKIGGVVYTLKSYDFTKTNLVDAKPSINYYAGNMWSRKTYQIGQAEAGGSTTIEAIGNYYGYDEYWGSTQAQTINYIIQSEKSSDQGVEVWGGTAFVSISSSTTKQLKYEQNKPQQISFKGGYVQKQYNDNILKYSCKLPEFDRKGAATDKLVEYNNSLKITSFPVQTRLPVTNTSKIRGHWAEKEIGILYSLEVIKGNNMLISPDKYISRAELASAIVNAAKEVPLDPALLKGQRSTTSKSLKNSRLQVVSPFSDLSTDNTLFEDINSASKRGIFDGVYKNLFSPNSTVTVAEAATMFVNALGLKSMAPENATVTNFRDNASIPAYAKDAIYVAAKIGLLKGDEKGNINPLQKLTRARTAVLVNKLIEYMRDDIRKDYRERIVNF